MTNVKLSQIVSGGAFVQSTDNIVTVRNGNTDVLTTLPSATSSTLGIVKPDNTTITISTGVLSAAAGAGGKVTDAITQTSHGFSVGNVLLFNGTAYALAQADSAADAEVVGIVSASEDTLDKVRPSVV